MADVWVVMAQHSNEYLAVFNNFGAAVEFAADYEWTVVLREPLLSGPTPSEHRTAVWRYEDPES